MRLRRLAVLVEEDPPHLDDEPLVGGVDAAHLDLGDGLVLQEVLPLGGAVVPQLDVGVEEPRLGHDLPVPRADREAWDGDRPLVEREADVHELGHVDVGHPAEPLALGAHAFRAVEAEGGRGAGVRGSEPAEHDAQHGVGVGRRADRGAGVGPHALLVDDDRGAEVAQGVDVGPAEARHERLDERRVGLVDQALRLGGDGAEDQRGLSRPRDAGEDREPPLRDVQRDVRQVVLPGPAHLDHVVAVRGGPPVPAGLIGIHMIAPDILTP